MAIVPMKKVLFVTLAREGEALLRRMQELGVLHPEHIREPIESDKLVRMEHKLHVQDSVIRELENRKKSSKNSEALADPPKIWEAENWVADEKKIVERISQLERDIQRQTVWGDFDPVDIKFLEEKGIFVQLWSVGLKKFENISAPDGAHVHEVFRNKSVFFATVNHGEKIEIPNAEEGQIPEHSLISLYRDLEEQEGELGAISRKIDATAQYLKRFREKNVLLKEERDFFETLDRSFEDDSLTAFAGWVPTDDVERIKKIIGEEFTSSYIKMREPLDSEVPPVKTKNSWLAGVFEPLLHLLGFPKYRGLDPALFFAPFMMVFFGICLGDAGYGLFLVAAGFVMRKFLKERVPGITFVSNMCILFGSMTIIWGLLTGTIFGIDFKTRGWIPIDVSPGVGDPMLLFKIAIGAGVLHLTIALFMAFFNVRKFSERLSKLGVIAVMWGGILGVLKVPYWYFLLGAGAGIILIFSSDSKNPAKRIGLGLWNIYGLTGLLGDVMSYARLFGLGIATAAIASVVNMLAGDVRAALPALGDVFAILVLVVGHCFNFAMGIIGALVHPARLHAVEAFPKCVELTGTPYKPLSKV